MTSYLDATVPSRSEHLWRYTPWSRVHPGAVDTVPQVDTAAIKTEDFDLGTSAAKPLPTSDIARIFLNEILQETTTIDCNDKDGHIHIHAEVMQSQHISTLHAVLHQASSSTCMENRIGSAWL